MSTPPTRIVPTDADDVEVAALTLLLVSTKRKRLAALLNSTDIGKLSASGQIQARLLPKAIDSLARKMVFEVAELDLKFDDLMAEVERLNAKTPTLGAGFAAMLTKDDKNDAGLQIP